MTGAGSVSLRVAMPGAFARLGPQLAAAFSTRTGQQITFAPFRPSGLLAQAILAGGAADVFVSANVTWMRRLQRAGIVRHWSTLGRNRLCMIAVPSSSITCLADLARPGLKLVAPQPETDPCGHYVELLWARSGLLQGMRHKQSVGELVRSIGSGDLPGFLLDGRVEVGILYLSEARQLDPRTIRTLELPPGLDMHDRIRFVVAAITDAGSEFVRWLRSPAAQAVLSAAGFLLPGTTSWRADAEIDAPR